MIGGLVTWFRDNGERGGSMWCSEEEEESQEEVGRGGHC